MKSPFPGMDPYLEAHWDDIHPRLIVYISDQLQPQLPKDLRARVEQGLKIVPPISDGRRRSDVHVTEPFRVREDPARAGVSYATPLVIEMPVVPRHVEIVDQTGKVITAIEVLSPSNKRGEGRRAYLKKQEAFVSSGTNLVEIDLVRAGEFVLSCGPAGIPLPERAPYCVCIYRENSPTFREVYPLPLRQKLPAIHIPLRPSDEDVGLDLHSLIQTVYHKGGYDFIDYTIPPDPPLTGDDAIWTKSLVSASIC